MLVASLVVNMNIEPEKNLENRRCSHGWLRVWLRILILNMLTMMKMGDVAGVGSESGCEYEY